MSLLDSSLKWLEKIFANDMFGIISGANVRPCLGLAVHGKVFESRHHVGLIDSGTIALKAADGGDADTRGEIRILSIGFFSASPTRIARQVDDGGEALLHSTGTHLDSGCGKYILDKGGIPSRSERDGLRIGCAFRRHVTVKAFVVEQDGNAEPRVFDDPMLNCVGELRHLARSAIFARARHSAESIFKKDGRAIGLELAILPHEKQILIM